MFKLITMMVSFCTLHIGGGAPKNTTTTQKSDPWSGVQPYITDYLSKSKSSANNGFDFYNGDTIAGFSPEQELGFNLTTQRALAGSPTLNAANTNITNTLNGDYLNPSSNPYLQNTVNQALGDVQTRVNSQFNNNNFGGSAHQESLSRSLGDQANALYGQNYTNERNNQLQAASQAIPLAGADYGDAQALQGVGAQRQALANQYLGLAGNTYGQASQFPYQQLDRYGNAVSIGMGAGGTSTTTSPNQSGSNPLAGALGGAAAGSTFGPWGAVAGGVLGAFSDVRLKSNIERVGTHPLGIGIYDYDKFGKRERGVMAQEVEKVLPEAVNTHPSGFKMVNYGLLGA